MQLRKDHEELKHKEQEMAEKRVALVQAQNTIQKQQATICSHGSDIRKLYQTNANADREISVLRSTLSKQQPLIDKAEANEKYLLDLLRTKKISPKEDINNSALLKDAENRNASLNQQIDTMHEQMKSEEDKVVKLERMDLSSHPLTKADQLKVRITKLNREIDCIKKSHDLESSTYKIRITELEDNYRLAKDHITLLRTSTVPNEGSTSSKRPMPFSLDSLPKRHRSITNDPSLPDGDLQILDQRTLNSDGYFQCLVPKGEDVEKFWLMAQSILSDKATTVLKSFVVDFDKLGKTPDGRFKWQSVGHFATDTCAIRKLAHQPSYYNIKHRACRTCTEWKTPCVVVLKPYGQEERAVLLPLQAGYRKDLSPSDLGFWVKP